MKAFVVPELNMGQMVLEVERAVAGKVPVIRVPHAGGTVHEPERDPGEDHGGGAMSEVPDR